jgi:hypothetical protein
MSARVLTAPPTLFAYSLCIGAVVLVLIFG